jgi:hypothetical protein
VRGLGEHVDRPHPPQPIAGLAELGGVGRQRGRVAGHVDDPLRPALDYPPHDLLREAGAGRVDDDDVGPTRLLDQRPHAGAGVGRHEAGVPEAVGAGVALGVCDRLGDDLQSPDLSGVARHRQPDRADPAEEVEDALAAGEPGELAGDRVEALGHLGIGLEEGGVGHLQLEAAELLAQTLLAEHPGRAVGAARVARDDRVQVDRWSREPRLDRHQPGLDLAGAPTLAHREVAQDAAAGAAVVGGNRLRARPFAHRVARLVPPLARQVAVLDVDDHVPAPARVEAERRLVSLFAEGVLELVAVAPLLHRRHDLLQLEPLEAADPAERVGDLLLLVTQLALVGEALPRRSRAGLAAVDAAVGEAIRGGLEQLDRARLGEALLALGHLGTDPVAGQRPGDEDDQAVGPSDPSPAEGKGVDLELELVSAPRYGSALRACLTSRSSSLISPSRCFLPFFTSSPSSFSASLRVIRPRLTASSTTSWMRSRLSVTLCSRLSRNWATLLSSPLVALLEALPFELDLRLLPPFFEPAFEVAFFEALVVFDAAFLPPLLAFAFVDFFAFDAFGFDPVLLFALVALDLPAAFLSAI